MQCTESLETYTAATWNFLWFTLFKYSPSSLPLLRSFIQVTMEESVFGVFLALSKALNSWGFFLGKN